MRGGLRWPYRPLQVTCVLVAVLLTAAFSLSLRSAEGAGRQPIPDNPNLGSFGERLNADTIAIVAGVAGNPGAIDLTVAHHLSDVVDHGTNFPTPLMLKPTPSSRRASSFSMGWRVSAHEGESKGSIFGRKSQGS